MGRLLLNLRNVPDEELEEVRELLREHGIEYYETEPSRWFVSFGALWLSDERQADEAHKLLSEYQQNRRERERARYEAERAAGEHETLGGRFRRQPLRFLVMLAGIGVVLYLALIPFMTL